MLALRGLGVTNTVRELQNAYTDKIECSRDAYIGVSNAMREDWNAYSEMLR